MRPRDLPRLSLVVFSLGAACGTGSGGDTPDARDAPADGGALRRADARADTGAGRDARSDGTAPDAGLGPTCPPPASAGTAAIRGNQVGYRATDPKKLLLMTTTALTAGTDFVVQDGSCKAVLSAAIGADLGSWSTAYPHVYPLDASTLSKAGHYTIHYTGGALTTSTVFTIGTSAELYAPLLANALFFYQAQRDGSDVVSTVLDRKASHLTDTTATVYTTPTYKNDTLQAALAPAGGPAVDVSGGWFDAGDYIKFVQTASYTVAVMLASVRDHGSLLGKTSPADFYDEAVFGVGWLSKMWDDGTQTLLYQVGIGDGSAALKIAGDHDEWRLPEADDALGVSPGDREYFIKYRPAFLAGPAGSKISPNLAGRLAADFGLCSQVFRATDAALADQCLLAGEHVLALADGSPTPPLLTTAPHDYYPETAWQDDLELGATEMSTALATAGTPPKGLPVTDPKTYLVQAASWAKAYIGSKFDGGDSLNLYDVSALAHYELSKAIVAQGSPSGLAVTPAALLSDLEAQVAAGAKQAAKDPFGLGVPYGASGPDAVPHALGLAISAELYEELSGDETYDSFGDQERDYVLGANAWGTSFLIGDGQVFPDCPQHQVANLAGHLDGTSPVLLGAVGDGPTAPANLKGLGGLQSGMNKCPPAGGDAFSSFNATNASYEDNVLAWPTVEPADDYTVLSVLLFARQ